MPGLVPGIHASGSPREARSAPNPATGKTCQKYGIALPCRAAEIEFDPATDARNQRERGLSFRLAPSVFANLVGQVEDTRQAYGEQRMIAFGIVAGRMLCLVYTMRGDVLRVISLRRANRKEMAEWQRSEP